MPQIHIIYHTVKPGIDCPDGIIAAAVAWSHYQKIGLVSVEGACYRKEYPDRPDIQIPDGTTKIVIVDFSYPASWLNHWISEGLQVEVLEHHADKFPWLEGFSGAILDKAECGATIAWKYYYPDTPIPKILEHVRRRDIGLDGYYQGKAPDSEAFNLGLGSFRRALKYSSIERKLEKLSALILDCDWQSWSKVFKSEGEPQIVERDRLIAERLPKSSLSGIEYGGTRIPCAFYDFTDDPEIAPHYSVLGHKLAEYHGVELAWMVDGKSNHLRSTTDQITIRATRIVTNCTGLARARGGGGHPCASGWQS